MLGLLILLVSVAVCVTIGLLVLSRNSWDKITTTYVLLTLTLISMSVFNFLAVELTTNQLLFVRLVMATSTISVFLIYLLVRNMAPRQDEWSRATYALLFSTVGVAALDMTKFVFPSVIEGSPPTPVAAPLASLYFLHFIVTFSATIGLLSKMRQATHDTRRQAQYRLLLLGTVPILLFAPLTSFILPNIFGINELVVLTPIYALIFAGSVGYAVIRHGLFDVQLAAVRSLAYLLSLGALAAVYYLAAFLISTIFLSNQEGASMSQNPINVVLALLLAFLFQPIKGFFDRITDRLFFRNRYNTSTFIANFGALLASSSDLRQLLEAAAEKIAQTMKAGEVTFVIHRSEQPDEIVSVGAATKLADTNLDTLRTMVSKLTSVSIVNELLEDSSFSSDENRLLRYLKQHRIELILPIASSTGYALLGEQKSSGYKHRDVIALESIRDELYIAIQNARSLEEVQQLNKTLQQRIDSATKELRSSNTKLRKLDATKDEFISMASHQLRTPLTSIKGYVSMLLDGDAGEISQQQRKLLSEAFVSSERMVRLISDFLNVSRLQTGKFILDPKPVDLVKLVQEEVDGIERMAAQHELNVSFRPPRSFPTMVIDEDKVRQVVMNYIDNAVYYSRPKSTIVIKLSKDVSDIVFEVHDHGIGVPKEVQAQLFSKFFRADNARRKRPDGTGIGLFLAKKIITAHSGEVLFSSTEGKGSMFGFRLPKKQPTAKQ